MLIPYPSPVKSYLSLCLTDYIFLSLPFQTPTLWRHLYFLHLLFGVPRTPIKQWAMPEFPPDW